jgi:hypothetical protein
MLRCGIGIGVDVAEANRGAFIEPLSVTLRAPTRLPLIFNLDQGSWKKEDIVKVGSTARNALEPVLHHVLLIMGDRFGVDPPQRTSTLHIQVLIVLKVLIEPRPKA